MIGIVLVTHNNLAKEFIHTANIVMGSQEQLESVSFVLGDDMEQFRQDIIKAINSADRGNGVILLTDMFGGTASNLAVSVMNRDMLEVVSGLSLPMLVKLISIRDSASLKDVTKIIIETGKKHIDTASNLIESYKS